MSIHQSSKESFREERDSGRILTYREAIYKFIKNASEPLTDREIMRALGITDPNKVRPNITNMRDDGILKELPRRVCRVTGKKCRVTTIGTIPFHAGKAQPKKKPQPKGPKIGTITPTQFLQGDLPL